MIPKIGTRKERARQYASTHKLFIMVSGAIIISIALVTFSMYWYRMDGTSEIDLSTPRYQSIRDKVKSAEAQQREFSSLGTLNQKSFDEFNKLLNDQMQETERQPKFTTDSLKDENIKLVIPVNETVPTQ